MIHAKWAFKSTRLPVAAFMDRNKVTKAGAQNGFINFVMTPLFTEVAKMFPGIEEPVIKPIQRAAQHYKDMSMATAPPPAAASTAAAPTQQPTTKKS